jgi:hypothetical protein
VFRGAFLALAVGSFASAQSYTVTPISIPSGYSTIDASTINNSGQVAFTAYNAADTASALFIGSASGNTPIPVPSGWVTAITTAINASGQVTGDLYSGNSERAFIGTPAGITVVPFPPGWINTNPSTGINNAGFVAGVGTVGPSGATGQAYIGSVSFSRPIPFAPGWTFSFGRAVNNLGQVTGDDLKGHIFIGTISGSSALPLPAGFNSAIPYAINDSGQVVGTNNPGGGEQAFISTTGGSFAIGPARATYTSVASGSINNSGIVVGYSGLGGWIWSATSGTQMLTSLVPTGWFIGNGVSISDNGHILAQGQFNGGTYGYLDLFPTGSPAPATLIYPNDGSTGISQTPPLTWVTSSGSISYDVYFGTSPNPPFVTNVTGSSYTPAALASNTTYYWKVIARNNVGSASSAVQSFTTFNSSCTFTATPPSAVIGYNGGPASINVTTAAGCAWSATSDSPWLTITSGVSGTGNGTIFLSVNGNSGSAQLAHIKFASQTVGVMQGGTPSNAIFNDVQSNDPYFDYVSLMSNYGITAGCQSSPLLYCPSTPVTRAQMSVFVVAGLNLALGTSLTYAPTAYFQDVPATGVPDSIYFPFVQRIAQLGITAGCQVSPALYCPDESITQGQMAVFMIVAWMQANNLTTFTYTTTPYFTDVPETDIYFKFVQKMRDLGFWTGCSPTLYCESSPVTRDQMAPMIMRSMLGVP